MPGHPNPHEHRTPDHAIDSIFVRRWSPRAMSGKAIDEATLMRLFEAARWAASTRNEQEWRYLYARRDTPHFSTFFNLLADGNKSWCGKAGVLGLVVHAMGGFDRDAARRELNVPDDYEVEAMFAVGHPGDPAELSDELREREVPSGRKPLSEIVVEGSFAFGD